jgi:hypothetical protein
VTDLSQNILRILIYYDIFDYPLTTPEIFKGLKYDHLPIQAIQQELDNLNKNKVIYMSNGYYMLKDDLRHLERRMQGNEMASMLMKKAFRNGRRISRFPFVRNVFISGSLSKEYVDTDSDIDYFIITQPGRLWISRTLLILYKKIFLLNSYKYFCLNFFLDLDHLEIEDKNIFSATELMTLIPVYVEEGATGFFIANEWVNEYYAHFPTRGQDGIGTRKPSQIKLSIEYLFNNKAGEKLDDFFMHLTKNYLRKKFNRLRRESAVIFKKHIAKYHQNDFRNSVLNMYSAKVSEFESKYNMKLS